MDDFVPESAIDYHAVLRRDGANCGDEDFALFKCPACGRVYLMDYEVDTVYLDPADLAARVSVFDRSFECEMCGQTVPTDEPWVGPGAGDRFKVTWAELGASGWKRAARRG